MKRSLLLISLCFYLSQTHAATILLSGTNFDVQYDSSTLGSYGSPSISGDVVFFTPTVFKAESLNGNGFATSSGTINFQIIPRNNFAIANISLLEKGDYILRGADSFVGISGQTRAFGLSNPLIDVTNPITPSSTLSIATGSQQNWLGNSNLNLTRLSLSPSEAVNYTVENLLEAYTESAAAGPKRAFIEKKFSAFSVAVVSPVPEPAAWVMMLCGIGFVGLLNRKKMVRAS
jgi:PEP-CTERM motif